MRHLPATKPASGASRTTPPPSAVEAVWLLPLVLLPVAVNRLAPHPYVADRRLLLHVFGAAAAAVLALDALAWLWRRLVVPKSATPAPLAPAPSAPRRTIRAVLAAGAALLAVRCLTALSGLCPADSFLGLPARDGGLLSQLSCAAILLAALVHVRERVQVERILVAAFLGSLAPIAVGTLQAFGVRVFTPADGFPEGRLWGTFGNAILFGSYLVGVLPATLWTAWCAARGGCGPDGPCTRITTASVQQQEGGRDPRSPKMRLLAVVPALCAGLDVWLLLRTGSRGPLLAAAATGGLGLVLVLRRAGARNAAKALSGAIAVGIALFIGGVQLVAKSDSVQSMRRRGMVTRFNTVEVRLMLYEAMTRDVLHPREAEPGAAFRDDRARWRPWIGYGTDCLTYPLLRGLGPKLELAEGLHRMPDSTHSATMDALGGSGIAGLVALLALLGAVLCAMARAERLGEAESTDASARLRCGESHHTDSTDSTDTSQTPPCGAAASVGNPSHLCHPCETIAPNGKTKVSVALPIIGALAGAVGMVLLWGGHTWALGALAGGYVGVLAAISALMRRNVPGDPSPHSPGASELVAVAGFCMAAAIWIDAQFALWTSTSALLLHAGLAIILLSRKTSQLSPPTSHLSPFTSHLSPLTSHLTPLTSHLTPLTSHLTPSPFGSWCLWAVVLSVAWLGVSIVTRFDTGILALHHSPEAFRRWLDTGLDFARSLRGGIGALTAVALVFVPVFRLLFREPGLSVRRFLTVLLALAIPALVGSTVARHEWSVLSDDLRLAGANFIADGGLPGVALQLCPPDTPPLDAHRVWLHGQHARVWLVKDAHGALPAGRAAAWARAASMADACAAARPFDGAVVRAAADVCLSAAASDTEHSAHWNALAIPRLHAALALSPGSNTLRQRLAKAVFVRDGGDGPALRAVFDEMLGIEPENPVAHSMLAQFALAAATAEPDPAARLARCGEAVDHARRALASPSFTLNRVDGASIRATLDAALAEFRRQGVKPPPPPAAAPRAAPLETPRLPAGRRKLVGAFGGAALAALVSFLLVPPVRRFARWAGWLDAPAARKVHRDPTPLLGGVAILAGVWTAALALPAVPLGNPFGAVLGIATALAAVGVVDDRRPLPWQLKLGAQFAAAAALYAVGVRVRLAWLPGAANVALTIFWLVGVTNAVNFLDNMNGLSNGLAAWSAVAIAAIGLVCGEWDVAAAALALAGACVGFLRGNNPWRGSIFMGDTGSLFLGLSLASLALLLRFPNNANWVTWLCPVLLLAVPVFDMSHVCLARLRRGRNPFSTPGKDHTSHLFERMGLSRPNAVLAVHTLVVLCAAATWVVSFSSPVVAYAVAGAVLAGAVFLLVYFELRFGIGGSDEYKDR